MTPHAPFERFMPARPRLHDLSHRLALVNRYCGGTQVPYTVAQHSCLVAESMLRLAVKRGGNRNNWPVYGLLHDAHEAWIGDWSQPACEAIEEMAAAPVVTRLKAAMDTRLFAAFGLGEPDEITQEAMRYADEQAYATERRDCALPLVCDREPWAPPLPKAIKPWPWPKAEERFIEAFKKYALLAGLEVPV